MPIALVQTKASQQGGFPSASSSFDSTPTAGNFVLVVGNVYPSYNGGITGVTVTDNQGNTYTTTHIQSRAANDAVAFIARCPDVLASGTFTVTAKGTISGGADADAAVCLTISEWSGMAASSELDLADSVSSDFDEVDLSTSPDETDTAEELVVSVYAVSAGGDMAALGYPSGFTGLYFEPVKSGGASTGAGAYRLLSSTGVASVSWPDYRAGADEQGALLQTFRAASGGDTFNPAWARGANAML